MVSPRLQPQRVSDRIHRREPGQRDGRGFDMRERCRLPAYDGGFDRQFFGIGSFPADIENAKNRIADLKIGDAGI